MSEEVLKCLNCGFVYEEYGDDFWLECPNCRSDKYETAVEGEDYERRPK